MSYVQWEIYVRALIQSNIYELKNWKCVLLSHTLEFHKDATQMFISQCLSKVLSLIFSLLYLESIQGGTIETRIFNILQYDGTVSYKVKHYTQTWYLSSLASVTLPSLPYADYF